MQSLMICLVIFIYLCANTSITNSVKDRLLRSLTNRRYQQLLWSNYTENILCYKTVPYSHVLALNSSGSPYNIVRQPEGQPNNDTLITILDCCDGFKFNVTNNICLPICTYECQENAYCIIPEMCICKPGYEEINGQCKPNCPNGCRNGECVAPDVCQCGPGQILNFLNECIVACEENCMYGTCRAGVCTCHEFSDTINDRESCNFQCPIGNECKGECVAINICKCKPGFKVNNNTNECVPITDIEPAQCTYGCGPNGRCVVPNRCDCDPGFRNDPLTDRCVRNVGNNTDASIGCQNPCLNGYCSGPDQCTCNSGYTHDNDDLTTCVPICEGGCSNGVCSLPNVCICNFGYREENGQRKCAPQE